MSGLISRLNGYGLATAQRIARPHAARSFHARVGPVLSAATAPAMTSSVPNESQRLTPEDKAEFVKRTWDRRRDPAREKAAREHTEVVPLPDVTSMSNSDWTTLRGDSMLKRLARYDNVFADVFGAEFDPSLNLRVRYGADDRVVRGNLLAPEKLQSAPTVAFEGEQGQKYTLVMSSPDDCIYHHDTETLHWMITNMDHTGAGGDAVCAYLPPTPPKGTGYHRYVFALYKQQGPISVEKMDQYCTMSSAEFAQTHKLQPVGLAFMQCTWDSSVTATFARALGITEPSWTVYKA